MLYSLVIWPFNDNLLVLFLICLLRYIISLETHLLLISCFICPLNDLYSGVSHWHNDWGNLTYLVLVVYLVFTGYSSLVHSFPLTAVLLGLAVVGLDSVVVGLELAVVSSELTVVALELVSVLLLPAGITS